MTIYISTEIYRQSQQKIQGPLRFLNLEASRIFSIGSSELTFESQINQMMCFAFIEEKPLVGKPLIGSAEINIETFNMLYKY